MGMEHGIRHDRRGAVLGAGHCRHRDPGEMGLGQFLRASPIAGEDSAGNSEGPLRRRRDRPRGVRAEEARYRVMKRSVAHGGTATRFASGAMLVVFALMPLLAPAAAPPTRNAAEERPRFSSLQVEIWPEFDRRGEGLVILKGELAADSALPATVC